MTESSPRLLSRWHAAALVAGSMVGVGIFLTPRLVAAATGTGWLYFGLWLAGAALALTGALAVAELGAMVPQAGGDYVYLRLAYGDSLGFVYGWQSLLASFSGSIAAMAYGVPRYQGEALFGPDIHQQLFELQVLDWKWAFHLDQAVALGLVWGLTALACRRVRVAGRAQLALSGAVMGALLLGAAWALVQRHGRVQPAEAVVATPTGALQAFVAVSFAYSGWNAAGYVASEIEDPGRNLPFALGLATAAVGLLYLLLNAAFVLTLPDVAQAPDAGSATASALLGPAGGQVMAAIIAVAVTGAVLASIVTGGRIYYAMARQGQFPVAAGQLHPRWQTPWLALVGQATWVSVLILSSTFDELLRWSGQSMLLLSVATVVAVPWLRRKYPDWARPYRAPGHPWVAIAYCLACLLVFTACVRAKPWDGVVGLGTLAVGWLAGLVHGRRAQRKDVKE